ncbi:MAG: hypothetical protein EON48_17515 [Acetobacteraceae bacterium]|nr:MAG: hypothetical protein EON48_17515 [Acetobacteraceae bacterium]
MNKFAAPLLALTLALTSTTAFAGGPVVIEEEPVVEAASPRSGWIVPVVVGLILVCAIACGNDDPAPAPTPITPAP